MTRLSEKGLNLIKRFEGLRLKSYKCAANVDTVGYGHTGPEVVPGMTISEEQAEKYLRDDLERFEQCVSSFVKLKINQNEYDALVSFSFNVGTNAFVNSTLLKKLNAGNKKSDVASEFLRWVKADGKTIPGLVRRREEEKKVFLTEPLHPMLGRSIYAKQDTWLKRLPVDSSLLEADKKLLSLRAQRGSGMRFGCTLDESIIEFYSEINPQRSGGSGPTTGRSSMTLMKAVMSRRQKLS